MLLKRWWPCNFYLRVKVRLNYLRAMLKNMKNIAQLKFYLNLCGSINLIANY